jgi:hypothetical protein
MSHNCEYCDSSFSVTRSLKRHQKTNLSCIEIQKSRGICVEKESHKCDDCGRTFTQKSSLNTHKTKIHKVEANVGTINSNTANINPVNNTTNNTNNANNNTILIFNFGETFSDITKEKVMEILDRCLDKIPASSVGQGIGSMTEIIAPLILRNSNGNWISRVADSSRNKLAVKTKDGEEPDINGHKTSELLRDPIRTVGQIAFRQEEVIENKKDIINTLKEIENDGLYGKKSTNALMKILPNEFESKKCEPNKEVRSKSGKTSSEISKQIIRRYEREQARLEEAEKRTAMHNIASKSHQCFDGSGTYWNKEYGFVIQSEAGGTFSIIGRKNKMEDARSDLTKADIKKIHDMKLGELLAPKYKITS